AAQTDAAIGQVVNVGSGREISIGDLARLIGALAGVEARVEADDQPLRPPGSEVERLLADNARPRRLLEREPRVVLEDRLRETIDWMRANLDRYRLETYAV